MPLKGRRDEQSAFQAEEFEDKEENLRKQSIKIDKKTGKMPSV